MGPGTHSYPEPHASAQSGGSVSVDTGNMGNGRLGGTHDGGLRVFFLRSRRGGFESNYQLGSVSREGGLPDNPGGK